MGLKNKNIQWSVSYKTFSEEIDKLEKIYYNLGRKLLLFEIFIHKNMIEKERKRWIIF